MSGVVSNLRLTALDLGSDSFSLGSSFDRITAIRENETTQYLRIPCMHAHQAISGDAACKMMQA